LDTASVKFVKNDNPDSGEASEYIIIECNQFQFQITLSESKGLQERFDNEPHLRRHVPPPIKKVKTGIPEAKTKTASKKDAAKKD